MSQAGKTTTAAERVVSAGFHQRVYQVVRSIPPGSVATYGQVAEILGHPGVARHVGNALAVCEREALPVPWHRVLNAKGMISTRGSSQRAHLEAEGVEFTAGGAVKLEQYRWRPRPDQARPRRRKRR
jgi:methylated-DNA-protein-cysteine methyltransferase related protein